MKIRAFLLALIASTAAADTTDIGQCMALADAYRHNPLTLTMGQLDTLRLCITDQMAAITARREQEQADRAITRNFGRDGE